MKLIKKSEFYYYLCDLFLVCNPRDDNYFLNKTEQKEKYYKQIAFTKYGN